MKKEVSAINSSISKALPFAFASAKWAIPFFVEASVRQVTDWVVAGSASQVNTTLSGSGEGAWANSEEYLATLLSSWEETP